jgi:arylsulfatase A-like enzyme
MKIIKISLGIPSLLLIIGGGTCNASKNNAKEQNKPNEKPNIIYILADDLGYGDLGCYGQTEIKTPALDKMAADGIRFTRHYAGSTVSAPSRAVLMTGLHTGNCKIRGNNPIIELDSTDHTIASTLKTAGYTTAAIGKWSLGDEGTTGVPSKLGFDYFFGYLNQIRAHNFYIDFLHRNNERVALDNKVVLATEGYAAGVGTATPQKNIYTHDLFTSEALNFIEQNANTPFFLYLAVTIPHANNEHYIIGDEHGMEVPDYGIYKDKNWPNAQKGLAAMISYLDKDIGAIRQKLEELGIDKNTIIMFTSDNGPHAEGNNDPTFFNSSGGLRGTKRDLYEGGIRVPMIACWPGKIKAGRVTNHVSAFWDVLPTLADIAGIKKTSNTDGISFLPTLLEKKQTQHNNLYWEFNEQGGKQAVIKGDWKLIKLDIFKPEQTRFELYNLKNDPFEKNDVSKIYPKIVDELKAILVREHTHDPNFPINKN